MGLLGAITLILFGAVNRLWYQLSMGDTIASQFTCHDLSGLTAVSIAVGLQIRINHFAMLVDGSPTAVLPAIDADEKFIEEECIALAKVFSL